MEMKLENQVVSLEIAKKLKELGVEQNSLFYWWHKWEGSSDEDAGEDILTFNRHSNVIKVASAFTVAELGEMLPTDIKHRTLRIEKGLNGRWLIFYGVVAEGESDTEANARGKMLIYLLENNLTNNHDTR